jgi:hypothetical protein
MSQSGLSSLKPLDRSREQLFEELKRILGDLPTRLPEAEVVELARAAWKEAVINDVLDR